MRQFLKNMAGFTLLEILLVVGVGAVLLLAGIGTFQLVSQKNNINEGSRLLSTVMSRTQDIFKAAGGYGTLNQDITSIVVNAGGFPSFFLDESGNPQTPWKTALSITALGRSFQIEFSDLPEEACIQMAVDFIQENPAYVSTTIGGGSARTGVTLAQADNDCLLTADDNDVVWIFN